MSNTKKMSKPLIIAAAAIVAVIVIIAAVSGGAKTVVLADYTEINVDGYNGYATAKVDFDYSGLEDFILYGEKSEEDIDEIDDEDFETSWERLELLEECLDTVEFEINKKEEISNGDKLEVTFTWSEEAEKLLKDEFKIKLEAGKEERIAEGLEDAEVIDPFDFVEVVTEGVSGYATAKPKVKDELNEQRDGYIITNSNYSDRIYIKFSESDIGTISYSVSKAYQVSNGDKIIVHAKMYGVKDNMMLAAEEKEFTLKITEAFKSEKDLKDNLPEICSAYTDSKSYSDDISFEGAYLVTAKNNDAKYDNKVIAIFKYESTGWFAEKYYYAMEFCHCYEDSDGQIKYADSTNIGSHYQSIDEAFEALESEIDTNYYTYTKG